MTSLRTFDSDVALLSGVLDDVIRAAGAEETLAVRTRTVELATLARSGDEAAGDRLSELIAGFSLPELELLVRSLTRWFQLITLAEDNERVRRIRARAAREAPAPRAGSLADAVARLTVRRDRDQLQELLDHAEVRLVMTAHPTEARRRT